MTKKAKAAKKKSGIKQNTVTSFGGLESRYERSSLRGGKTRRAESEDDSLMQEMIDRINAKVAADIKKAIKGSK